MTTSNDTIAAASGRGRLDPISILFFVVGICAFVVTNVFLYLVSYPGFPGEGPQSDVRVEVGAVFVVLVLVSLLGRAGHGFARGFVTGFAMILAIAVVGPSRLPFELLFAAPLSVQMWISPEGAKLRDAKLAHRIEEYSKTAAVRRRQKWIAEMHHRGLDEAEGTRRALLIADCVVQYRLGHGNYPRATGTVPDVDKCAAYLSGIQTDEKAWRTVYRTTDKRDNGAAGFTIVEAPDTAIGLDGPIIEANEQGLFTMRAHAGAPAYIRASPLPGLVEWVMPCLGANIAAYSRLGEQALTMEDLIGRSKISCTAVPLGPIYEDSDPTLVRNPNVSRLAVSAPGFERYNTAAVYNVQYVMHGSRQGQGYDLYAWPMTYAYNGMRSYLLAADGSIHVTTENRRATLSDPLGFECEYDLRVPCGTTDPSNTKRKTGLPAL